MPKAKQDTNHVKLLISLSKRYRYKNKPQAKEYIAKSLELANDLSWNKGIIKSYQGLGVINSDLGNFEEGLNYYNKAEKLAIRVKNKFEEARAFANKGFLYQKSDDYINAKKHKLKYINIKKKVKDTLGFLRGQFSYQYYLVSLGNYDEALKYSFEAASIWETTSFNKDLDLYIRILNSIGILYGQLNDDETAIKYYNKAERIGDSTNHTKGLIRVWINRANSYGKLEKYKEAERDLNKSLEYTEKRGLFNDYNVVVMGTLASLYEAQKLYDEAISITKASLAETKKRKMDFWTANNYITLGNIYFSMTQDSTISEIKEKKLNIH